MLGLLAAVQTTDHAAVKQWCLLRPATLTDHVYASNFCGHYSPSKNNLK